MEGVVIGECNGWNYRPHRTVYHSVMTTAGASEWYEEYSDKAWGDGRLEVPLLSDIPGLQDALKGQLVHGDVVDFHDYRGCGAFIVEPVDSAASDFYLHKTIEEMGYGVPPYFADAPQGYYDRTECYYVWKHVDFVDKDDPLFDEVAARIENPQYTGTNDWAQEIVPSKFPDGYLFLQDFLNGRGQDDVSWITFAAFSGQMYFDTKHWKFWKERKAYRSSRSRGVATAVCDVIFHKRLGLPQGIAAMIAGFGCSQGGSPVDPGSVKPVARKRRKKRRKKVDSDDEDWAP